MTADEHARGRAYRKWRESPEAIALKYHKPLSYEMLLRYPGHFHTVREAFHLTWVSAKLIA